MGLGPPNNLRAKNYTVRAFACRYWYRRRANDSELVYANAGSVLYGGSVKRHERVNAFNLVFCLFLRGGGYLATPGAKSDVIFLLSDPDFL